MHFTETDLAGISRFLVRFCIPRKGICTELHGNRQILFSIAEHTRNYTDLQGIFKVLYSLSTTVSTGQQICPELQILSLSQIKCNCVFRSIKSCNRFAMGKSGFCLRSDCRAFDFVCEDGLCISAVQRCDGEPSCNGEDEMDCLRTQYGSNPALSSLL